MAKKFLVDVDLLQNELQNGVFQHLTSAPSNPKLGQFYFDTTTGKFGLYEGTSDENKKWVYYATTEDLSSAIDALGTMAYKNADDYYTKQDIVDHFWSNDDKTLATGYFETTASGTNGTAMIWNETDGGGSKFVNNNGVESFVGVNDGTNGLVAQIYADKEVDGKWQGAKLDVTNEGMYYTVGNKSIAERDVAANELAVKGDVTSSTSEAKAYTDAEIQKLDTAADVALATASDGVVTIKAVKEVDGIISASTDTSLNVTLAKVATTGKAEDVSVADAEGKITATTVEGALEEIVAKADANAAAITTLNGDASTAGSVAKSIADKLGTITSTNYVAADATVNANVSTLDAKVKEIEDATTGTTIVVDETAGTATVTKGTTSFTTYVSSKEDSLLNEKADKATTLAGYGIEDAYTKTEIDAKVASTFHYKGTVDNYADLPTEGQQVGDVWNIKNADPTHGIKAGDNVAWNGTEWDVLGGTTDLSAYALKADVDAADEELADAIADAKDELHRAIVANKTVATNPALTPAGGIVTWTVSHNYGEDVDVVVKEAATGEEVVVTVLQTNNLVTIKFNASAAVAANTYRAVIMGVVAYNPTEESGK